MKIIFDKDLQTEFELPIANYFEHFPSGEFSASKNFDLSKEIVPSLDWLIGRKSFNSIDVVDENEESLPIIGSYNHIADFTTSCFEKDHKFTYSLALTSEE